MRRSSMSHPLSELRASSANVIIASLKSLSVWIDKTLADLLISDSYWPARQCGKKGVPSPL